MQRIINPALAKANMSKTELGARLGVTQQNISKRIQRGKFTLDELQEIARCMGAEFNCSFDFQMCIRDSSNDRDFRKRNLCIR